MSMFKETIEKYNKEIERLKKEEKVRFYPDGEVIRKIKVYLHNKGITLVFKILLVEEFYVIAVLITYKDENPYYVLTLTCEDTINTAYNKVDRYILKGYKNE